MINNSALVLIIGIAIGVLLSSVLTLQIFIFLDLKKKFKELFKKLQEGENK